MVKLCCVDGCNDTEDDVTYFKFPNSRTLKRRWLDAFTPIGKVTIDSVVCSRHFLDGQYELVRGKKRLKAKVVPSVFQEASNHEQSPKKNSDHAEENENVPADTKENGATDTEDKSKDRSEGNREESIQTPASTAVSEDFDIVKRSDPSVTAIDSEANNDIEDIITNYHIKQIRPLNTQREALEPQDKPTQRRTAEDNGAVESATSEQTIDVDIEMTTEVQVELKNGNRQTEIVIDVDNIKDPVFVEVAVDKSADVELMNQDCLMLLESVQCEVDPSSLMFLDNEPHADADASWGVVDLGDKKEDPISLLTSSDEDEVIIEEPHIDTVEVSDETDEDDIPLVKLVKKKSKKSKKVKSKTRTKSKSKLKSVESVENDISRIEWNSYEYYCVECHFRTTSNSEFKKHTAGHATVIQICQTCSYTTASKAQFARHKRKHQDEKKYKCHLCDYKARHNMSLIYHLKSHDNVLVNSKRGFRCEKCGFQSDLKTRLLKHIRLCSKKDYVCGKCGYETKRKSDLRRHKLRRHKEGEGEG